MRMVSRRSRYFSTLAVAGLLAVALAGSNAHAAPRQQPQGQEPRAQEPHGSKQAHAEQSHGPHAHVYLLRGLFNVFSLGMDTLAEELSKRGVDTSVNNYADWQTLADHAAAKYKAGSEGPIILIGHSLGADAVVDMAAYLGRRDVPVALVIPFDGTHTLVAPANVARLVNLTQRNYAYARPGPGFKGSLANVDVSSDANIDHINIDKAARTHARAISEVLAAVGRGVGVPKGPQAPEAAKPSAAAPSSADDTTGTTPMPSDAAPSSPMPPAAASPAPTPPASVAPEPAPAAMPNHASDAGTAPPAAPHPPVQDANAGSFPADKASPPPSLTPQAAAPSNPASPKPSTRPSIAD
jgi:predicted alpha/beta hydrolase family esterase